MCGITGIISKKHIQSDIIKQMTDTIIHRGPDGFGYYQDDLCAFGHRRLSIVDLSAAGRQPMEYMERYVITFNGEIYNYPELRKELELHNYSFQNHTDTEVIMASYDLWGTKCLNKFNGMWAFVIYDRLNASFFISRDRFGKKPLYYYRTDNMFIFASEIKAILAHPDVQAEANTNYITDYLQTLPKEYIKETAFKNIYRFDFASYFEGDANSLLHGFQEIKFWAIQPNVSREQYDPDKAKYYAKQYYELLEDAVKIRLRADVKVGSALSGGLDSSSIVYIVNNLLKAKGKNELQETFSSVYKTKGTEHCDESQYINAITQKLQVHSNQIEPLEADIPIEYVKMIYALETPPENSLMSSWHTFKLVSQTDVKVTLDGQGADEQLAGYLPYLLNYLCSLPLFEMIQEARLCFAIPHAKKYVIIGVVIALYRIVFGEKTLKQTIRLFLKKDFEPNLNKRLSEDLTKNLITMIHYADHTSMAFSIESRMPFMDYRLVEFLATVPACYKMRNGWTKYIARLAFDQKLPDEVNWRRDKMGWPIPEQQWFNGTLKQWFVEKIRLCEICNTLTPNDANKRNKFSYNIKKVNLFFWERIFLKKTPLENLYTKSDI